METTTITTNDIYRKKCKLIKNCIDSYLSTRPNISIQSLEEKTKIGITTLRRIIALKVNPLPESVIKILTALGDEEALSVYMKEFHPDIAKIMGEKYNHNKEYKFISQKNKTYFTNPSFYLILNLAATTSGTSKKEITYHIGDIGLHRLEELIEAGLIVEGKEGRYFGTISNYKLPFSDTKKRIKMALDYYRVSESGAVNNWMSFQTESINEEGLKAMKELSRKHFNERKDKIYNNPMYKGDIKHYSACVSSTFLPFAEDGGLQ